MSETGLTTRMDAPSLHAMKPIMLLLAILPMGACVNISAPDKPIEINLNINVTQEVVYRLDSEAKSLIQQNPGIF